MKLSRITINLPSRLNQNILFLRRTKQGYKAESQVAHWFLLTNRHAAQQEDLKKNKHKRSILVNWHDRSSFLVSCLYLPRVCWGEGRANLNLLVSWLMIWRSINFNGYLVCGSSSVINSLCLVDLSFGCSQLKYNLAATAVKTTIPMPVTIGRLYMTNQV